MKMKKVARRIERLCVMKSEFAVFQCIAETLYIFYVGSEKVM